MKLVSYSSEGCRLIVIIKIMFVVDDHFQIVYSFPEFTRGLGFIYRFA
jgi:hypothetical protein